MEKKLVVAELSGTIYDTHILKNGLMSTVRTDRTDEAINAVAEHMKLRADENETSKGFWQYIWKGIGTLTWENASDIQDTEFSHNNESSNEVSNEVSNESF